MRTLHTFSHPEIAGEIRIVEKEDEQGPYVVAETDDAEINEDLADMLGAGLLIDAMAEEIARLAEKSHA